MNVLNQSFSDAQTVDQAVESFATIIPRLLEKRGIRAAVKTATAPVDQPREGNDRRSVRAEMRSEVLA